MPTPPSFAQQLRLVRRRLRLSQLALSVRSGVSQRHLSFLESERARPGREVVFQLSRALKLSLAAERDLLFAAGFAQTLPPVTFDSTEMVAIRDAAERILEHHNPYPGLLMDRAYYVIRTNAGFDALLARVAAPALLWQRTSGGGKPNLLKLSLHPEGLRPHVPEFRAYASALLLRAERAAIHFPALQSVLEELTLDPLLADALRSPSLLDPTQTGPAWMETYRLDGQVLRLFSVQSTIGVPMDVAAESMLLECFFPANAESAALLEPATDQ